jgi:hypothetical protein
MYTEGSKSNIPCCALLLARQVHAIFASDSRMWRASGVNLAHMSRKWYAQNSRHVARVHHTRTCRATIQGDVTFGPLCTLSMESQFNGSTHPADSPRHHCSPGGHIHKSLATLRPRKAFAKQPVNNIGRMQSNNRFVWSQSCQGFNMALQIRHLQGPFISPDSPFEGTGYFPSQLVQGA